MSKQKPEYHFPPIERALTDLEVFRLVGELRSDRGTPKQARELMALFVVGAYTNDGPSRELITFVRDALAEYLSSGKSLDAAFRLKKGRRGRPVADDRKAHELAEEMLRQRVLDGLGYDAAARAAAARLHSSRSVVCSAFEQHKIPALNSLLAGEAPVIDVQRAEQVQRLRAIFPWFAATGSESGAAEKAYPVSP